MKSPNPTIDVPANRQRFRWNIPPNLVEQVLESLCEIAESAVATNDEKIAACKELIRWGNLRNKMLNHEDAPCGVPIPDGMSVAGTDRTT